MNTQARVAKRAKELIAGNPRANPINDGDNTAALLAAVCEEIDETNRHIKEALEVTPQCTTKDMVSALRRLAARWEAEQKQLDKSDPTQWPILKCACELGVALDWCEDGKPQHIATDAPNSQGLDQKLRKIVVKANEVRGIGWCFIAHLEDVHGEVGQTAREAIGSLIEQHPQRFDIEIEP